jgi:hypothetical protein
MKKSFLILGMALSTRALSAQTATAPTRVEIMAGANFAKLSTSGEDQGDVKMRTGLVVGVGLIKALAPSWSFQPELTYSMKGAKVSDAGFEFTSKLSYLEVPLLLRYDVGSGGDGVRPFIHAGPALALKLSCSLEGTDGTTTASTSCDDENGDGAKTFDLGLMFGGGLAFRHMNHTFSVGVRYNLGLLNIAEGDGADTKNRVLSIVGTFEWPWGK